MALAATAAAAAAASIPLSTFLALLLIHQNPTAAASASASTLFPPSHEEYDQNIFDPRNMFGAPYGGYARASQSRIAALPLRLVGGAGFDLPELVSTGGNDGESDAAADAGDSAEGGSEVKPSSGVPHFQLSDAQGRRFVCRSYHEDELENESVTNSMFDAPELRDTPLISEEEDEGEGEDGEDEVVASAGASGTGASEYVHQDNRIPATQPHVSKHRYGDQKTQAQTQQKGDGPIRKGPVQIHASDINNQLKKLKGVCAQIHLGWWSYEWCHESVASQFHVSVVEDDAPDSALPGARKYEIESVTNLGKYQDRVVRVDNGKGGMPHFAPDSGSRGLSGSIVVVDTFVDGDWCGEASVHRSVEVEMRCCHESELKGMKTLSADGKVSSKDTLAVFLSMFEPPGQTCHYKAKVCSPLLCSEAFQDLEEGGSKNKEPALGFIDTAGDSAATNAEESAAKAARPTANEAQRPTSNLQETTEKQKKKGKKESIRNILEQTLGSHCLQRNAGWWTYELCHTRQVREFHGANKIDVVTGVSRQMVEEEHMLGYYDVDALDSFPDEEEVNYVINATDPDVSPNARKNKGSKGPKGTAAGTPPPPPDAGGNGAVFVQEYLHGDVCEDPDVTDSVVKAGGIVDGGIQRATTVRFSCGKNYELVKVNEDSTCHYVFDVTVPALCKHPLFKAPVVKTQVVKCLPID